MARDNTPACMHVEYGMAVCTLWRAGKRGQRSRHTLDAPALEYVPAGHWEHARGDGEDNPWAPYLPAAHAEPEHELAPVALEYFPASQEVHVDAPASQREREKRARAGKRERVRDDTMRLHLPAYTQATCGAHQDTAHTRHAGRREERQQCSHGHPPRDPRCCSSAASRIRACMQQDATGSLGTCIHTQMRARQHMLRSAGKGGQRSRHTLDAPVALAYLPATHRVHVVANDEVDPRGPYAPAAHAVPEHVAVAAEVDPPGP